MNDRNTSPLIDSWGSDYFIMSIEDYEDLKKDYFGKKDDIKDLLFTDYYEQITKDVVISTQHVHCISKIIESFQGLCRISIPAEILQLSNFKVGDIVSLRPSTEANELILSRCCDGIHCSICHNAGKELKKIGAHFICDDCFKTVSNLFNKTSLSETLIQEIVDKNTSTLSLSPPPFIAFFAPSKYFTLIGWRSPKDAIYWEWDSQYKEIKLSVATDKSRCVCCKKIHLPGFYKTLNGITICNDCLEKLNKMP